MSSEQSTWAPTKPAPLSMTTALLSSGKSSSSSMGGPRLRASCSLRLLAQEHGARLIGVFMQPEAAVTRRKTFARARASRG